MASGIELGRGYKWYHIQMLDDIGATNNGIWMSTGGYGVGSFHIKGITTATVKIVGSNDATIPANTDHGIEIVSVTSNAMILVSNLPKWIKAYVSAWTAGTIDVTALLRVG